MKEEKMLKKVVKGVLFFDDFKDKDNARYICQYFLDYFLGKGFSS